MGYTIRGGRVEFTDFSHHVTKTPSPFELSVDRNLFLNDTLHGEILAVCSINMERGRGGSERERVCVYVCEFVCVRERDKREHQRLRFLFFSISATTYSSCY